jgi:hypothetical protein
MIGFLQVVGSWHRSAAGRLIDVAPVQAAPNGWSVGRAAPPSAGSGTDIEYDTGRVRPRPTNPFLQDLMTP